MLTLPLLIAADALKMRGDDIRRHGVSLFMTAGVNVFPSHFQVDATHEMQ